MLLAAASSGLFLFLIEYTKISVMRLRVLLFIVLFILIGVGVMFVLQSGLQTQNNNKSMDPQDVIFITIKDTRIVAEVVDTPQERTKGLSQRTELGEGQGLLFIFQKPGHIGIWMKDMIFPIDILWFDEEKNVTDIKKNATPESYPEVFYPSALALYVLEVNVGFAEQHGIEVGDQANW